MFLRFNSGHLSITAFPEIELPSFTIVTGRNGSGKTHLLRAIESQKILIQSNEVGQLNTGDIRFYDWSSLTPNDPGVANPDQFQNEKKGIFDQLNTLRSQQNFDEQIRQIVRQTEAPNRYLENPSSFLRVKDDRLREFCETQEQYDNLKGQIANLINSFEGSLLSQYGPMALAHCKKVSEYYKRPALSLNETEIMSQRVPLWGHSDIFQQQFGRIFVLYRDTKFYNDIAGWRFDNGKSQERALNDDEFLENYGEPPWDFVNRTIRRAGLDFYVSEPPLDQSGPFHPTLHKRSSDTQISYNDLSSGEKILMSLAICVYNSSDAKILPILPKLMLFDEIDATLHPSMAKGVMETISTTLLERLAVGVIMTTHSASTVALAPEDSVHVMLSGSEGLAKTTKSQALNILTEGVPTLSISFDGRRQVLVEGPLDAEVMSILFRLLRSHLDSERSLEFLATGTKTAAGSDINTGQDVVKALVKNLAENGTTSVLGLIDHDGKNEGTDRVFVLGNGERDGAENYIFDPVIMVGAILRLNGGKLSCIGLDQTLPYADFLSKPVVEMQATVDRLAEHLFGGNPTRVSVDYVDGSTLSIDDRFLKTDDHALHDLYVSKIPLFNGIPRQGDGGLKLLKHVTENVLADRPGIIPMSLKQTFEQMLAAEF
jgi:ABC-type branched-subunit amino acid transport system ATPase component